VTEFQETVFNSAQELFALGGYEGTSISDIAARAGIAKSTVLHHFPSKRRLYQRVMRHSIDQFTGILEHSTEGGDIETQVAEKFSHLLRWMIAEPVHAKLLNRIFLDRPQAAPFAAKRYWLPLMDRLTAIFPADYPMEREAIRLRLLFVINSIFQMALSIELQVLLIGERMTRDDLCARYEAIVKSWLGHTLPAILTDK
jgi:AcrR family transcriptional regulator